MPRCAGSLGLHLSLCGLSSLLAKLALYCRTAPTSRPGPQRGWGCTWDWRVGGPLTQRQVVLVAGVALAAGALAAVRAATPGQHGVRCAHQQDGHRGLAASEGRRAG